MQTVNTILLSLIAASVGTGLPQSGGTAIGQATQCKYMVSWQEEKPGYKWIWVCKEDCVTWQFSDKSHPECLRQVPIDSTDERYVAAQRHMDCSDRLTRTLFSV
ncbi:hypothetical protein ISF_06172 [Cordyceps fumosorosea ARSEF 2679]|uniref:Uncharacterized protein n=1 Tax=Cordyceps fumosorosea (strain ARSEF 2679) TaxID=1081104 RepID=A0A167T1V2_CORFA|nr:hypothetical protein ISF_06172 [Cordyceps fumosorosea ARSEF 2679]OAA60162.1 hypothetical protein ISF_06172 [Cordyceps fumosorosea ARSEF 2679]